jgi:hypothetical protein
MTGFSSKVNRREIMGNPDLQPGLNFLRFSALEHDKPYHL